MVLTCGRFSSSPRGAGYLIIIVAILLLYLQFDAVALGSGLTRGLQRYTYSDGQIYYLYVPNRVFLPQSNPRLLVAVHGYNGRKNDMNGVAIVNRTASRWSKLADKAGWIVLAPQFDQTRFDNDYQRLNLGGKLRADSRLNELIQHVGKSLSQLNTKKVFLFGFSGGAQFVHRYVMLHPDKVERAVAGSAGWYLMPEENFAYPKGVRPDSLPRDLSFSHFSVLQVPMLVIVGEDDRDQGPFKKYLRLGSKRYDLRKIQGVGRRERAEKYVAAMCREEWDCQIKLEIVANTEHKISKEYKANAVRFLTGER